MIEERKITGGAVPVKISFNTGDYWSKTEKELRGMSAKRIQQFELDKQAHKKAIAKERAEHDFMRDELEKDLIKRHEKDMQAQKGKFMKKVEWIKTEPFTVCRKCNTHWDGLISECETCGSVAVAHCVDYDEIDEAFASFNTKTQDCNQTVCALKEVRLDEAMKFRDVLDKIINYLESEEEKQMGGLFIHSTREIAEKIGYNKQSAHGWVRHCIETLEYRGLVERIKKGKRIYWKLSHNRSNKQEGDK